MDPVSNKQLTRRVRRLDPERRYASWWWAIPALGITILIHYVAVGTGSIYSLTNWKGIGPFHFVGIDNFISIFSTSKSQVAILNTFVIAVVFVILANVIGLAFALALNRQLKTRYLLRVVLFAPVVLSSLAISYIWKFIFAQDGPLNNLLAALGQHDLQRTWLGDPSTAVAAIIVVVVWQHVGLTMVIYLAGLANIPPEIEEAAAVDGAGVWRRFISITLPMLRPTILIATTLILIRGLSIFDQVLALTGGGPYGASETLATQVYTETFVNGRYGYGAALSLVLTVMIVVFALAQNLFLREKKEK